MYRRQRKCKRTRTTVSLNGDVAAFLQELSTDTSFPMGRFVDTAIVFLRKKAMNELIEERKSVCLETIRERMHKLATSDEYRIVRTGFIQEESAWREHYRRES